MTAISPPPVAADLEYYEVAREDGRTILAIWETGEPYRDSVTPSIWSTAYRRWIGLAIQRLCQFDKSRRILSLGCGNAFVEADLTEAGYQLLATDAAPEAVTLARAKGVLAQVLDFWMAGEQLTARYDLVYADGLIGHLLTRRSLADVLKCFRRLTEDGGLILISNDSAENGGVERHPSVPGFYYVHVDLLAEAAEAQGLTVEYITRYSYDRPLSGPRWRSVIALRC